MHKTPEITRLIHENFWLILSFALARPPAIKLLEKRFKGEWKYLHELVMNRSEVRADRALLEMGTQLRVLDDEQGLNDYLKQTAKEPFGSVNQGDGKITDLHFRDMTNKIMHAARFEWILETDDPAVICYPHDRERWESAEIKLLPIMALVGELVV